MTSLPWLALLYYVTIFGYTAENDSVVVIDRSPSPGWERVFTRKMDLEGRMGLHQVPGLSIALINNNAIEWSQGFGLSEKGGQYPVDTCTLFQSGSIGKSVIASTALQFVEKDKFKPDMDVNRILLSWKIPENSFTLRSPVTLERLLCHLGGVNLPGVIGYRLGDDLPDLDQILNGEPPANTPPIVVDQVPGVDYKYSGGGYMIVQRMIMDYSDPCRSFPEVITERIFDPVQMYESTFDMSPGSSAGEVASGHRSDGTPVSGKYYRYPEMGMGVFWTSPTDMCRFIIEIMKAYQGIQGQVLLPETARIMLSPHTEGQGLGVKLGYDGKNRFYFYHRGAAEGFQTFMVAYPDRGQGAVIMTNSDNGYALIQEILEIVSKEYRWLKGFYF